MNLSDLAKYAMTRSGKRPLCDSRATCWLYANRSRQFWGCACVVSRDPYVAGEI